MVRKRSPVRFRTTALVVEVTQGILRSSIIFSMTLYLIALALYVVLVIIFLAAVFSVALFMFSLLFIFVRTKGGPSAPFVPLPKAALLQLVDIVHVQENDVVYDLGCGDGRVVRALSSTKKVGRYVGIERNFFVYCLAILYKKFLLDGDEKENVNFIFGDIFKHDLSSATRLTMYLFPGVLKDLEPKLEKELQKGSLVYSVDFTFPSKKPKEIISLGRAKHCLGRYVYVYEF